MNQGYVILGLDELKEARSELALHFKKRLNDRKRSREVPIISQTTSSSSASTNKDIEHPCTPNITLQHDFVLATPQGLESSPLTHGQGQSKEPTPLHLRCCCGCDGDASRSEHYCSITGKRIWSFCTKGTDSKFGSKNVCNRCAIISFK